MQKEEEFSMLKEFEIDLVKFIYTQLPAISNMPKENLKKIVKTTERDNIVKILQDIMFEHNKFCLMALNCFLHTKEKPIYIGDPELHRENLKIYQQWKQKKTYEGLLQFFGN